MIPELVVIQMLPFPSGRMAWMAFFGTYSGIRMESAAVEYATIPFPVANSMSFDLAAKKVSLMARPLSVGNCTTRDWPVFMSYDSTPFPRLANQMVDSFSRAIENTEALWLKGLTKSSSSVSVMTGIPLTVLNLHL